MTHTLVSTAGKAIDLCADLADRLDEIAQQPDLIDALAEALAQDRPKLPPRLRALLTEIHSGLPSFEKAKLRRRRCRRFSTDTIYQHICVAELKRLDHSRTILPEHM